MRQSVNEVIIFVFPSPLELKPGRPPLPAGPHQCTKHINHTSKGKESHADDKDLPCAAISNRPRSAAPVFHGKGIANTCLHLGAFRSPCKANSANGPRFVASSLPPQKRRRPLARTQKTAGRGVVAVKAAPFSPSPGGGCAAAAAQRRLRGGGVARALLVAPLVVHAAVQGQAGCQQG
jgi:hypothetical protein